MNTLSPTMQACVDYMKSNGDVILRYPGGFWAKEGWYQHNGEWFATTTIQALVKRGYAQYESWKETHGAKQFPVSACLIQPPPPASGGRDE